MHKAIIAGLMASLLIPATAAVAQSRAEIRRDIRDVREEQRELRQAYRSGDRRDIREERRDVRDARRELREDRRDRREYVRDQRRWGREDWRTYRTSNRTLYARGNWRAPFRHRTWSPGYRISTSYYRSNYFLDPYQYRLPYHGHARWVRHYDDVLLVDTRRGIVLEVIRNFFW